MTNSFIYTWLVPGSLTSKMDIEKKKEKNNYHFLNIVANKKKYHISFKKEA